MNNNESPQRDTMEMLDAVLEGVLEMMGELIEWARAKLRA